MSPATSPRPQPPDDLTRRTRYFPRKVVASDDLELTQNHGRAGLGWHALRFHGWGVHDGAEPRPFDASQPPWTPDDSSREQPKPPDDAAGTWVVVGAGDVIDPDGRTLAIARDVILDLARPAANHHLPTVCPGQYAPAGSPVRPPDGLHYLAVRYTEAPDVFVPAPLGECEDRPEAREATRIESDYAFRLFPGTKPSAPTHWVVLGQLRFDGGKLVPGSVTGDGKDLPRGSADRVAAVERQVRELQAGLPAGVLGALLPAGGGPARLADAAAVLREFRRKLSAGLRACFRPEGMAELFRGRQLAEALDHVPAGWLDYGPPDSRLDAFFAARRLTAADVERIPLSAFREAFAAHHGGHPAVPSPSLEAACQAAGLAHYLVRQWPGSHLDRPEDAGP